MSDAERVRHPDGALNPPREKKRGGSWWWLSGIAIAAFILIAIFRPQGLEKIGIHVSAGASKALGGIANPHGWV